MIFDNVDDAEIVLRNAPSSNGLILVTTRYKEVARDIQAQCLYELAPLDRKQSLSMYSGLRKMWDSNNVPSAAGNSKRADEDPSQIEAFLAELDGLPLAIEQMAARGSFTDKSTHELHQDFRQSYKRVAAGVNKTNKKSAAGGGGSSEPSTMSLATVWDIQFSEIRGTVAGRILGLLSLLSHDSIPTNLFMAEDDWDEEIYEMVVEEIDAE